MTRQAFAADCHCEAKTLGPSMCENEDEIEPAATTITTASLRGMRRRCGIPIPTVTRVHESTVHRLDLIAGWIPVVGGLERELR